MAIFLQSKDIFSTTRNEEVKKNMTRVKFGTQKFKLKNELMSFE